MAVPIKYILQGEDSDGSPTKLRADKDTKALSVITHTHEEIHEGSHFYAYKTASITNGQILTLALNLDDALSQFHMFMEFDVAVTCTIDVLEDVTSFAGGVAFTILNNRRDLQSTHLSGATCLTGHTGSDLITPTGGSEIYAQALGAGNRAGGALGHDAEILLKTGSKYLFRITNGTTTQGVSIILQWYEHLLRAL